MYRFNLEGFIHHWPLQIKKETNYKFDDFHSGFKGNNIIAKIVYNKLLDIFYGFKNIRDSWK